MYIIFMTNLWSLRRTKFSIVCKTFYIESLLKELSIREELKSKTKKPNSTSKWLKSKPSAIVNRHAKYMKTQNCPYWVSKITSLFVLDSKNAPKPVKTKIHCCFAYMFYKTAVKNDYFLFKTDPNNMRKLLHRNQKNTWFQQQLDCQQFSWSFERNHPVQQTQKS